MRTETIPKAGAIYQSEKAKTYQCPHCFGPVFCQYEGESRPVIECLEGEHVVKWADEVHE